MEGKKSQSRAILVFGAPCSGKTSFCELFAKKYGVAFYNLDELRQKYNLSRKQALMLVEQVAKTGQNIIIEGEIRTEKEREEMRRILTAAKYTTKLVWVQADVTTIRARLKAKYKSIEKAKEAYSKISELEAPSEVEPAIILSGKHTFDTQAKHVIAALA